MWLLALCEEVWAFGCYALMVRSGQVRSGNLMSPGEPLATGYFVAPSKEKKYTKYS